jgi:hypothetical protein
LDRRFPALPTVHTTSAQRRHFPTIFIPPPPPSRGSGAALLLLGLHAFLLLRSLRLLQSDAAANGITADSSCFRHAQHFHAPVYLLPLQKDVFLGIYIYADLEQLTRRQRFADTTTNSRYQCFLLGASQARFGPKYSRNSSTD